MATFNKTYLNIAIALYFGSFCSGILGAEPPAAAQPLAPIYYYNPGAVLGHTEEISEVPEAPKMLYIIPVSYNPQNNDFHILLTQQHTPIFSAFLTAVDSFAHTTNYTEYMPEVSQLTFRAYHPTLKPSAIGTYVFDEKGQKVAPEAQEGYLYIEIPFITGKHIWAHGTAKNKQNTNFNWIQRTIIMQTAEGSLPRGYQFQIDPHLLRALKATLPLLKKQGERLVLTQYEEEKGEITSPEALQECPICLESKVLKVLPCGHTMCKECLQAVIKKNPLCPTCRAPIPH